MKTLFSRITGIALIIASVVGLIFSLFGLVSIWRLKPSVKAGLAENIDLMKSALTATSEGLEVADQSLVTTVESVTSLVVTIDTTARTIEATSPLIDTLATLSGEDLPATVANAQTSLVAAQDSARIIDSVLTALTSIPFVSKDIYNPPVPLHIALQSISESMDSLPANLETIEANLTRTGSNLEVVQADIDLMASQIGQINVSLQDAQTVIHEYQSLVRGLQERVDIVDERSPALIDLSVWVLTIFLLWMAVVQAGLFTQGWELLNRSSRS